jgi:hypothetical protein
MRLPKQRSRARHKQFNRPTMRWLRGILFLSLIVIAGCAGSSSGTSPLANFFGIGSATPAPTAAPIAIATPISSAAASPAAEETATHPGKRIARQARAASANAGIASKEAADASQAAALASKQAASVANKISGSGSTSADVSLEPNQATPSADPQTLGVAGSTPSSKPSTPGADTNVASISRTGPSLSASALDSSGPPVEENPERAAKMIQDLDKAEKRVDRKNLNADDSQRDVLAQRLLQEAKQALADHDNVAALSLATKASTLLEPLPKVADSAIPSTP